MRAPEIDRTQAGVLPRPVLQLAIERGIDSAPSLSAENREKLREVGRTAAKVGVNFEACPMTLAGLVTDNGDDCEMPEGGDAFVAAYDRYLVLGGWFTDRQARRWPTYFTITD